MGTTEEGTDREILQRIARPCIDRACADLTLPQYRLLALIVRGEERASGLAGQLALARPTVSAAVETLVANGLVDRTSVDGDRRAIRLTITPAGRAARRVAERAMRERLDAFLADVPDALVVHDALAQLAGVLAAQDRAKRDTPADAGVTAQR